MWSLMQVSDVLRHRSMGSLEEPCGAFLLFYCIISPMYSRGYVGLLMLLITVAVSAFLFWKYSDSILGMAGISATSTDPTTLNISALQRAKDANALLERQSRGELEAR